MLKEKDPRSLSEPRPGNMFLHRRVYVKATDILANMKDFTLVKDARWE